MKKSTNEIEKQDKLKAFYNLNAFEITIYF